MSGSECGRWFAKLVMRKDIEIISGVVSKDHVHLYISYPPRLSVSEIVKSLKERTSRKIQTRIPTFEEAVLGAPLLGHRVWCIQFGTCYR